MQTVTDEQLQELGALLAIPLFLVQDNSLRALNAEARSLSLESCSLPFSLPVETTHADLPFSFNQTLIDADGRQLSCSVSGRRVSYQNKDCWLLTVISVDSSQMLPNVYRIASAKQIMLDISSQIDHLETDQDIYDFILDNCGKAVEHAGLCSLMIVKGDIAEIIAQRGFLDDVRHVCFNVKDTFLAQATDGKMDRIAIINNLDAFRDKYHLELKPQQDGSYLAATLSTPLYVNHKLYAILNFDSLSKNAFTMQDEELLYVIKSNIEIILTNYRMHSAIKHLSQTDMLTGLYNRNYLKGYLKTHLDKSFFLGVFDLNELKTINDGHGHFSGDLAIQHFASHLRDSLPEGGVAFRIGGDEFLCILYYDTDAKIAKYTEMLHQTMQNAPLALLDHTNILVDFSCGFAFHPADSPIIDEIEQQADRVMYEDKARQKKQRALKNIP